MLLQLSSVPHVFREVGLEAVAWMCSVKKLFWRNSQNSQESTCIEVSFLIKLQFWEHLSMTASKLAISRPKKSSVWYGFILEWQPFADVLQNRYSYKFRNIHRKTPESLYNKVGLQVYLKETTTQVFSCEYFEIFKNSFFYRTPPVAASGFSWDSTHFWPTIPFYNAWISKISITDILLGPKHTSAYRSKWVTVSGHYPFPMNVPLLTPWKLELCWCFLGE